jgi:hypothetical protein
MTSSLKTAHAVRYAHSKINYFGMGVPWFRMSRHDPQRLGTENNRFKIPGQDDSDL